MKALEVSLKIGKVFKFLEFAESSKITVLDFPLRYCSTEWTVLKLFSVTDPYTAN